MEEKREPIPFSNEPEVVFNALSDKRIFGVRSEEDHEMIFEISGYDLQIRFNRDRLQTLEDIEGTLDGIKDMFRKLIMADLLDVKEESGGNAQ
jgi:hypothetical protein